MLGGWTSIWRVTRRLKGLVALRLVILNRRPTEPGVTPADAAGTELAIGLNVLGLVVLVLGLNGLTGSVTRNVDESVSLAQAARGSMRR